MPYPHPTTQGSFGHYRGLQESVRYLTIDQLEEDCIYLIHARNSYIGIWGASKRGFTLVRDKFGRRFLFTEFHWDTGAPFGTVKPFVKISGAVEPDCRRQALDRAEVDIPYQEFMALTRDFLSDGGGEVRPAPEPPKTSSLS
ncbi:MAG: hypothetical protein Q7S40_20555 [Opitutaceae bacterium]|nr:hypothetical protein [Opitutaceae bacterium]